MRGKRFTEEQIIGALKEAEAGFPLPDLLRKYGVSQGTFHRWKAKYGGMDVSDARRLKSREEENRRLKRLAAAQLDREPDPGRVLCRRGVPHSRRYGGVGLRVVCG